MQLIDLQQGKIRKAINELAFKDKIRQVDIAKATGVNKGNLSKMLSGGLNISEDVISFFEKKYSKKIDQLVQDTLKEDAAGNENASIPVITISPIPYFDIDASAGNGLVDMVGRINPDALLSVPGFRGADLAINVRGDSMVPRYNPGDIIALKKITDLDAVNWGSCHVVVTKEQAFIKYLRYDEDDPGTLVLRSHNESYQDIRLTKDKIRSLFVIKGKIERTEL